MNSSIQVKIISFSILTILILMTGLYALESENLNHAIEDSAQKFSMSTGELFETGLERLMLHSDERNIEALLSMIANNSSVKIARIISPDGIINHSLNKYEKGKLINNFDTLNSFKPIPATATKLIKNHNLSKLIVLKPIFNNKKCQSCHFNTPIIAYLQFDVNFSETSKGMIQIYEHTILYGIFVILIFIMVLYFIVHRFVKMPLIEIDRAFDEIGSGNYQYRLKVSSNDELSRVKNHFNLMVNDINEKQNQIEEMHFEKLRQIDKLATLGELTSGLSHEINNYSGILNTRLEYLLQETSYNSNLEEYSEDISAMMEQLTKMTEVTKNILRHSRTSKAEYKKFNLCATALNAVNIFSPLLRKRRIVLTKAFQNDEIFIVGDPIQIEQVIVNFLSNSIDAIVSEGEIEISIYEESSRVILDFKDNGSGIPDSEIKNVFMPFYTTKDVGKGSGLGLYIVKRILDEHQANIELSADMKFRTIFKIEFNGIKNG